MCKEVVLIVDKIIMDILKENDQDKNTCVTLDTFDNQLNAKNISSRAYMTGINVKDRINSLVAVGILTADGQGCYKSGSMNPYKSNGI